jgi:hypothetical protein
MRALALAVTLTASLSTTSAAQSICTGAETPLAPSRDLYCIELVRAVGIRAGEGRVELGRTPGPFTVDVTNDGHLRYTPVFTLSGLPAPSTLGRFVAYVAWLTSPTMDVIERLGVVTNGRTVLPRIALDKFFILISAEPSPNAREMTGKIVLRGMSPSTRLQPPDFMQFVLGATREDSTSHDHDHMHMAGDSLVWSTRMSGPGDCPLKP